MGNTGSGKHKDVHSSDSTLEFETGKKMFPSGQEAKMVSSGVCLYMLGVDPFIPRFHLQFSILFII